MKHETKTLGGWCVNGHTVIRVVDAFCAPLCTQIRCEECSENTWIERLVGNIHPTSGKVCQA
jgi:hypothetical protein